MGPFTELIELLAKLQRYGMDPPLELAAQLGPMGEALTKAGQVNMAKLTAFLSLALVPPLPNEQRPPHLESVVKFWMQQLWEACRAVPATPQPNQVEDSVTIEVSSVANVPRARRVQILRSDGLKIFLAVLQPGEFTELPSDPIVCGNVELHIKRLRCRGDTA